MTAGAALVVEMLKVRHAALGWISAVVAAVFPFLIGLVMAGSPGMHSAVVVDQSPEAYMAQFTAVVAIGGLIGFGFLFSWTFGREYADGTVRDLLALPVSRVDIVLAKFTVVSAWCAALAAVHFASAGAFTWFVFEKGAGSAIAAGAGPYAFTVAMVIALSTPVAFVASAGRGYLAPLAFVILAIVIAQLLSAAGWGHLFPWAVPGLYSGVTGSDPALLGIASLSSPFVVGAAGVIGTGLWWRCADQG